MRPVVLKGSQATKEGLGPSISSPLLLPSLWSSLYPLYLHKTTKLIQLDLGLIKYFKVSVRS